MDAKEVFQEAQLHLMHGRQKQSIQAFTKALEAGFNPALVYLARGVAHLQIHEHEDSMRDFTQAIEAGGGGAGGGAFRAYYYRGTLYMLSEEFGKAIEDFSKAIEINPEHAASFFARGMCHAQLEQDEQSAKDIRVALACSESATQGFMDSMGMMRTQFDKVMALMMSDQGGPVMKLTDKEKEKLKELLDEK